MINLSGNAIARIPTVRLPSRRYSRTGGGNSGSKQQPQQQQHRCLSVVDLSDNALVKFPQQLLTLVRDRLDLSRNQIAMVPLSLERKLSSRDSSNDKNSGRERRGATAELVMNDNPVVCPPEDVCRCGMRAILNYLREAKAHLPTYQGLKVWSDE